MRVPVNSEPEVTIKRITKDFEVPSMTLQKWLRCTVINAVAKPGPSRTVAAELREGRTRIRRVDQENEILRRAEEHLSQTASAAD